jgi:hypothetical protein
VVEGRAMTDSTSRKNRLTLNIAPVTFSEGFIKIGRVEYEDEEAYAKLREEHWQTHAFRFDSRDGRIANVTLRSDVQPLGEVEEVQVQDNLLLMAKAIQQSILIWLAGQRPIVKAGKRLIFWGGLAQSLLLSRAVKEANLDPVPGVEVVTRYDIDARMFWTPGSDPMPYVGVLIDISTSNVIDLSVAELINRGIDVIGKYVCKHGDDEPEYLRPRLELVGMVSRVEGSRLLLTDNEGIDEIDARDVLLEPRLENLDAVVKALYGAHANRILARLRQLRAPLTTATGKLARISQTLTDLKNKHKIVLAGEVEVSLADLLVPGDPQFPTYVSTSHPGFLFGPQGRKTDSWSDRGIQRWGPFKYMQHTRNTPLIAVVCEASYRGRVEQFLNSLRDGFPDESWEKATSWREDDKPNPFQGGLIGKFRLTQVSLKYEETKGPTAEEYRRAAERLLERSPNGGDLAIVQTRESFKKLRGDTNPYLASKAAFMEAGVPVQAICIENVEADDLSLPYILNNVALASYAKLDGIPWVISTRGPTSHELVFGLGYTEMGQGRLGAKTRYVGITTIFQGDGRYIVWGLTREVEFENYAEALLENLHTTIRYVKDQNRWQEGDNVRLIFHVYKPLKNREIDAIKQLVKNLIEDKFLVEYAFLNLSHNHMYQIFDPSQKGVPYRTLTGQRRRKGKGVPKRGLCYQLSNRTALLHLTGPRDLKTAEQGIPRPLLVELHSDSDFTDLTYLLRQIYHFTFMSWRSFFPATEPVTILYSRLIARMLGNLKSVTGWSSKVLSVGSLRNRRWFL